MPKENKYCYPYPRPAFTVDALVFRWADNRLQLLLIQRKNTPFEGMWAFPGGFVDPDETVENAVQREIEEETGLSGIHFFQFKAYSEPDRDPRGRTISMAFIALLKGDGQKATAGDDAAETEWFFLNGIPELAFDHHTILKEACVYMEDAIKKDFFTIKPALQNFDKHEISMLLTAFNQLATSG